MNPVHVQHTEWPTEQLRDSEILLVKAQKTVAEAKQNIAYIREMLKLVSDIPGTKDNAGTKDNIDAGIKDNTDTGTKDGIDVNEADIKRTPKQMLLPPYAGKSLIDAIHQYLFHLIYCLSKAKPAIKHEINNIAVE